MSFAQFKFLPIMMIASNFKLNLNLKPRANAGNLTLARRGPPGLGRAGPGLVGSPPPYPHTSLSLPVSHGHGIRAYTGIQST